MSTVPNPEWHFEPMRLEDLPQILAIENQAYPFPWTRGNFLDSLYCGYRALVLRDAEQQLLGYFLMMLALDEAHLLNLTVGASRQGQGFGRLLLERARGLARQEGATSMLLEVRPSNQRALQIYQRYGFVEIGRRKNYYPAADERREDAIVMRISV